jgi:hypothetical protein
VHGNARKLRDAADHLDKTQTQIVNLVSAHTKQPRDVVAAWNSDVDRYFNAEEALAFGLVDHIIEPKVSPARENSESTAKANEPIARSAETEDEKCLLAILSGFSDIRVKDREAFRRALERFFIANVKQA